MKLTNREKVILPVTLLIIAIALFLNFITFPMNKEIINLQAQSEDFKNQVRDAKVKQEEILKLEEQIVVAQKEFETQHVDILQAWDQPELLVFVENTIDPLCEKKSIDFFDVVSVGTVQAGDINIVLKTNYKKLEQIWKKFEESRYFNTVTHFDIAEPEATSLETSNSNKVFEVSMNLRFYSRNLMNGSTEGYDFMEGNYGKTNIFQ